MDVVEFERIVDDPEVWEKNYGAIVGAYFDLVTEIMCSAWGSSHHFPSFSGTETPAEAARSTACRLADQGRFCAGMRVLDLGSGVGGPALNIAEHSGAHITGLELVASRVEIARTAAAELGLSDQAAFIVGDMMSLPFDDNAFDAVYSIEGICYAPRKAQVFVEVARVLRPGGIFLGRDCLCGENLSATQMNKHIVPILHCHGIPNMLTLPQLGAELGSAGFTVEELCDASDTGDIARNWDLLYQATDFELPADSPAVVRMMSRGGRAIANAGRDGAFVIGSWRARLPQ